MAIQKFKMAEEVKNENNQGAEEISFLKTYGWLPTSIWYIKTKDVRLQNFCRDTVGEGSSDTGAAPQISQFHPDLAKRIIQFYTKEGDHILDPFAGRVRALIAKILNRNYTGYEISPTAFNHLTEKLKTQQDLTSFTATNQINTTISLINKSSVNLEGKNQFDMVFSCPPYWDLEDYNQLYGEDIRGSLSNFHNYNYFLAQYKEIIKKCYEALKWGCYAVFVVNDFRREGEYINFHGDTVRLFREVGFKQHDIIIWKNITNVSIKLDMHLKHKYNVKEHEYVLVFKKA